MNHLGYHVGFGEFIRIGSCICTGSIIIYKCTANGPGFTIWRGSAFNCPAVNSEIFLRHSLYDIPPGSSGRCNSGAVSGSSQPTSGGANYTSQLIINLTAAPSVVGRTVECMYRNPDGVETVLGSETVTILNGQKPAVYSCISLHEYSDDFFYRALSSSIWCPAGQCTI